MLALSVDPPDAARCLRDELALDFAVLSDADGSVVSRWGLSHARAGPGDATIAVPAQFLIRSDGSIAWSHVAHRITDRAAPEDTLAAVARL